VSEADCFWNCARGLAPVEHSGPPRKDMVCVDMTVAVVVGVSVALDMAGLEGCVGWMTFGGVCLGVAAGRLTRCENALASVVCRIKWRADL